MKASSGAAIVGTTYCLALGQVLVGAEAYRVAKHNDLNRVA